MNALALVLYRYDWIEIEVENRGLAQIYDDKTVTQNKTLVFNKSFIKLKKKAFNDYVINMYSKIICIVRIIN